MNLLIIQPLEVNQIDAVVELDKLCFSGLWTKESYQQELENSHSTLLTLVASQNNSTQLIGIGGFWAIFEEAHITILAIHPAYQGRGNGKLLLYSLLKKAIGLRLERATLEVSVSNHQALKLYQNFGFKIAGTRKGYYQKTGEDAAILWRGDLANPSFREELANFGQQIEKKIRQDRWQMTENLSV